MSKKYNSIYVAATSQHVGKTTSTLGLVSGFINKGINVGYCKPVGQKHLVVHNHNVDKDTVLFADLIHFDIVPEIHSPVILGSGAPQLFLDNPDQVDLDAMILNAADKLNEQHELVIYEGTGHPGVGSVAEISNARVAKILNAGVVMVVEGGIGNTIDTLNMSISLFREESVPILGVIINKVIPEKMEKVRHYCSLWLDKHNIPLLGLMPYEKSLAYPVIKTIADAVGGPIIFNADKAYNKIENILAGSLIDLKELSSSEDLLLVVSTRSLNDAISKIKSMTEIHGFSKCPLSGVVATGVGTIEGSTLEYIEENRLPLIRTDLDTYGCVIKISKIEVKINRNTPWKVLKAISLIEENVDLNLILS
ncbi:MAG: AAA family ATPase [Saprospiraceae bacterium]